MAWASFCFILECDFSFIFLECGKVFFSSPLSGVSAGVVGVAGNSSAALVVDKDSRVLRSRIPVKDGHAGGSEDLQPPLVSPEEKVRMVQRLKAALLFSLLRTTLFKIPSPHVCLQCLFLPGSALVPVRGWLFVHPLIPGLVPGMRGLLSVWTPIGLLVDVLLRLALLGTVKICYCLATLYSFLFSVFFPCHGFVNTFLLYYGSYCYFC